MPERGIPIFEWSGGLAFGSPVAEREPAVVLVSDREWTLSGGYLLVDTPRLPARLTPLGAVLAARGGLFGLSVLWGEIPWPPRRRPAPRHRDGEEITRRVARALTDLQRIAAMAELVAGDAKTGERAERLRGYVESIRASVESARGELRGIVAEEEEVE